MTLEQKPLPVKSVQISADIRQDLATVELSQVFFNQEKKPIEVEYVFPIPSEASLISLTIHTNGKVINAQVKELEEAKEEYSDLLAAGDNAVMAVLSDLGDVATINIGKVKHLEEIKVEIKYAVECKFESDRWRFIVPVQLIPRFGSSEVSRANVGQSWKFRCRLATASPAKDLRTSLKKFERKDTSPNEVIFTAKGTDLPSKDIWLSYALTDEDSPNTIVQRDTATGAIGLHFSYKTPSTSASLEDFDPTGEFILMLDRSGSMKGASIQTAKQAVELFIKSLPEKSLFNIISFGTQSAPMFKKSKPYSAKTVESAINRVKGFTADMRGTEILTPLVNILKSEPKSSFPRYVFLLTDGAVSNTKDIVELVEEYHKQTKVSTIGIGAGASSELIEKVAKAGKGSSTLILDIEQIKEGVLNSLEKVLKPTLNDISVEWVSGEVISQHPNKPFYAFNGDRISFNAILQDVGVPAAFRLSYHDSLTDERKCLEFSNNLSSVVEGKSVIALAVKGAVGSADEVRLSVNFQVLTSKTSLIAAIRGEGSPSDEVPTLVKCGLRSKKQTIANYGSWKTIHNHNFVTPVYGGSRINTGGQIILYGANAPGRRLSMSSFKNSAMPKSAMKSRSGTLSIGNKETMAVKTGLSSSRSMLMKKAEVQADREWEDGFAFSGESPAASPAEELISLQKPDGSWEASETLSSLLAKYQLDLNAVHSSHPHMQPELLLTIIVCMVLSEFLQQHEGTWKLASMKAGRWLKKHGASKMSRAELGV